MTPQPLWLLAELTYRCPLQCPYCSNPLEFAGARFRNELGTEDWCRVFREAKALGVLQLGLSGGEPLLRADLERLVAAAHEVGLYTSLITSAYRLTKDRLAALRRSGLDHVQISIQAADEELSNYIAGTASYRDKLAAYRWTKELGFPLTVNVVLHRKNLHQVRDLIGLAESLSAERIELGAERFRKPDEVAHLVEVLAVQHYVDREREPELLGPAVRGELVAVGRGAGDVVRQLLIRRLDADLDMVQPGTPQRGQAVPRQAVGRRDERRIQPDLMRCRDEPFEVGAQQRLAAREAELEYAQRLRFAEHAAPVFGAELVAKSGPGELQRVRAVGTLERDRK